MVPIPSTSVLPTVCAYLTREREVTIRPEPSCPFGLLFTVRSLTHTPDPSKRVKTTTCCGGRGVALRHVVVPAGPHS